jgi:malate dehydrogenase (oxaloacetate-decarboxylating)(NADP+)
MVHEFVNAVHHRWPTALIQFEDFSSDKASNILEAYRHNHLSFNDDIQGTGAVTLGAVLAAVRTQEGGVGKLSDQRIVICGAGSAGLGVASSLSSAMSDREGIPASATSSRFWVLDKDGLIGSERTPSTGNAGALAYARRDMRDGASLLEVVKAVKPTILLGFTGQGGTWGEAIIREMAKHTQRPIIFPLSNPTQNAECNAEQAYAWTEGAWWPQRHEPPGNLEVALGNFGAAARGELGQEAAFDACFMLDQHFQLSSSQLRSSGS